MMPLMGLQLNHVVVMCIYFFKSKQDLLEGKLENVQAGKVEVPC